MRGAMGRGYPFQGMSALRLSIEIRMTLASFGGPAGGASADAAGAADGVVLAEAVATFDGAAEAAGADGSTCGADARAGGASLEQAAMATGSNARARRRRTWGLITSTPLNGKFFPC